MSKNFFNIRFSSGDFGSIKRQFKNKIAKPKMKICLKESDLNRNICWDHVSIWVLRYFHDDI